MDKYAGVTLDYFDIQITDAIDRSKRVDPDGQVVRAAKAVGTVFGDEPLA